MLDKERWHVVVDLPIKGKDQVNRVSLYRLFNDNQITINPKSVSAKNYPKGRFKLKLAHPNEHTLLNKTSSQMITTSATKTSNKYGTNSIKVAIFWALIYLRAESEYKRFIEDKGISGHMEQLEIDY
jgi:hypothetical protein